MAKFYDNEILRISDHFFGSALSRTVNKVITFNGQQANQIEDVDQQLLDKFESVASCPTSSIEEIERIHNICAALCIDEDKIHAILHQGQERRNQLLK